MKYRFTRNIVGQNNVTFIKGQEVPADYPTDSIAHLLESGHIVSVESPADFLEKVGKRGKKIDPAVEALDPDTQPRSK